MTSCANEAGRFVAVTPDPAQLATCPRYFPAPPTLKPFERIMLPDGRIAVLLDTVIEREKATAMFILEGRGAWQLCSSAVVYAEDWSARVRGER